MADPARNHAPRPTVELDPHLEMFGPTDLQDELALVDALTAGLRWSAAIYDLVTLAAAATHSNPGRALESISDACECGNQITTVMHEKISRLWELRRMPA